MLTYTQEDLQALAQQSLNIAKQKGATDVEIDISEALGQSISVRKQETEQIEYQQDKSLGVNIFLGQKKGYASTSDFSVEAITQTIDAALSIAHYTEEDDCAGLAPKELMATNIQDLSLYHPWSPSVEEAIEQAKICEQAALDVSTKIQNSEGASVSTNQRQFVYANSHGFIAGYPTSSTSIACSVIAEEQDQMQRDYWYSVARDKDDLISPQEVGQIAANRTLRRLNARPIKTGQYPVVFEATVAKTLIGHTVGALSGGNLYRDTSFLVNSLGKQKLASCIQLTEEPHILKGLGSAFFDAEGVATHDRTIIKNGIIEGYFLGSYSARKLGMQTTGNANGTHNLTLQNTGVSFDELLKQMGTGLLVTELIGQGVDLLTGDYSRGAAGFWVENGQIIHPVEEITIAGNLNEILMDIKGIATDALKNQAYHIGSILIDKMTVAGNH